MRLVPNLGREMGPYSPLFCRRGWGFLLGLDVGPNFSKISVSPTATSGGGGFPLGGGVHAGCASDGGISRLLAIAEAAKLPMTIA